jgi:2-methylcitrate dehydratase PrpD
MLTTEGLIDYVFSARYEDLPDEVALAAKRLIMNTLGAIIGGSGAHGVKEIAGFVKEWGGKQEATIFLYSSKVPAHEAVLVNATMARALDFDEFNLQTGMHTGATVVPVTLAAAELCGNVTGKELIAAVVVAAEVMCRMRLVPDFCIGVSGWAGEVYGAFGGAIAAGKIMRLTKEEMTHALGLAYSQAAGNAQPIYDGALATRLQQGFSARAGLLSTILATNGVTGARDFLEGRAGFYPVYYRGMDYDVSRLLEGIGERYEFLNIATKPYPCCGFNMAPIENVFDIMQLNNLNETDISKIVVRVNQQMYNTVCAPPETKYRPQTIADAMFSLPYVVGTALLSGDVSLEDFSAEAVTDPERLEIANKVEIVVDEGIERESKELNLPLSLHEVEVETESGQCFSQKMYYAKGFPQKPMTMEDFAEKAKKCARYAVKPFPESSVEELKEFVTHLEEQKDASFLTKFLF